MRVSERSQKTWKGTARKRCQNQSPPQHFHRRAWCMTPPVADARCTQAHRSAHLPFGRAALLCSEICGRCGRERRSSLGGVASRARPATLIEEVYLSGGRRIDRRKRTRKDAIPRESTQSRTNRRNSVTSQRSSTETDAIRQNEKKLPVHRLRDSGYAKLATALTRHIHADKAIPCRHISKIQKSTVRHI